MSRQVQIVSVRKIKSPHGEYWYRFGGTVDGKLVRDTVEMSAVDVEAHGMDWAQAVAKRHLLGLADYLEEQNAVR